MNMPRHSTMRDSDGRSRPTRTRSRFMTGRTCWSLLGVQAIVAMLLAGCNILVPVSYIVQGPGTVDAVYDLPYEEIVVFVDDRSNILPRTNLRLRIADEVTEILLADKLVPSAVNPRDTLAFARSKETSNKVLSIDAIGEGVSADVVLYIQMTGFELTYEGMPKPTATCRVKVIDVKNDTRLFPSPTSPPTGYPVMGQSPSVSPDLYNSLANRRQIEEALSLLLSSEIVDVFRKHERVDLGDNLRAP